MNISNTQVAERNEKQLEVKLRRMATKRDLVLRKSKSRKHGNAVGTYQLVDSRTKVLVAGNGYRGYGMSLKEVESFLS